MHTRRLAGSVIFAAMTFLAGPDPLPAQQSTPARVTLAQFRSLRWLVGQWRGLDVSSKPFYEDYRLVNDSTIVERGFPDSTFKRASDSSRFEWRGGVVYSRSSGPESVATVLTATSVTFLRPGTTSSYTFTKRSADEWIATLRPTTPRGADVVYIMRRVRR